MFQKLKNIRREVREIWVNVNNIAGAITHMFVQLWHLGRTQESSLMLLGKINSERVKQLDKISSLKDVEFKVFSQFGQDGILQYLISHIEIPNPIFVEFGVEDYKESTTRFLLTNDNWTGLIIDGSEKHIAQVQKEEIYWRYDLTAKAAFITSENINELISLTITTKDIGVLVVDVDGNDYWIWEKIDVINPRIVICEYNSAFGPTHKITVPYRADFVRDTAHYSNLYFGASVAALESLGAKKGYSLIGCTSAGNDAVFVRNDVLPSQIAAVTAKAAYVDAKFRESRGRDGELTFLRGDQRLEAMKDLTVVDLNTSKEVKLSDL